MARFDFQSVGSASRRGLLDVLLRQDAQRRQQFLDGILVENQAQARAKAEMDARRQAQLDSERSADRLASVYGPSADLPTDAAATLRQGGYQIDQRESIPALTADGAPQPGMPYARRAETNVESLARQQREAAQSEKDEQRRFRDEQAQADRAFRGEQAQAGRDAARERAEADRDLKLLIADMQRSGSAETRALGAELKRLQIAAAQDKLDTTRDTRDKAVGDARTTTQNALNSIDRLLRHPGMAASTGAYELRGFTQAAQDFGAERDQLVASLTLPNLAAIRGPLSDKDILFVKQLATQLGNTRLSEPAMRQELGRLQMFLKGKMGDGGAGSDSGNTVVRWGRDANGRPLRLQ
jgi:hypothetical protein